MFMFNNLLVDKKLSLEFIWYMTINIIGVEFKNRGCALIWPLIDLTELDISSLNKWISLILVQEH